MVLIHFLVTKGIKMRELDYFNDERINNLKQFITPEPLRKWFAEQFTADVVFDCAVGSGQLLQYVNCTKKIGNDYDEKSSQYANENGIETSNYDYITMDDSKLEYDTVASNYPFSLKPDQLQKKYCEDNFKKFCNKKGQFVGLLDFIFILKSFARASKQGLYLCFPGIAYRAQEKAYRQFLIENRNIKKMIWLENCKFDRTGISILFLHLTKDYNETVEIGVYDFNENTYISKKEESYEYFGEDYGWQKPSIEKKDNFTPKESNLFFTDLVTSSTDKYLKTLYAYANLIYEVEGLKTETVELALSEAQEKIKEQFLKITTFTNKTKDNICY